MLFFAFSFLFHTDFAFDQDLGRHIKLGEIITQTTNIPKDNLFSYTSTQFTFINSHWLFGVLVFNLTKFVGLQLFLWLKIALFLISLALTLFIIPKKFYPLTLTIGFIFFHVLRERMDFRPEIFSFLFTSVTYWVLEKYIQKASKWIFVLPLIQLIWINTHIYFFIGLVLQSIYLLDTTFLTLRSHTSSGKLKIMSLVFLLSVLFSIINPNGIKGFLYPLNVTSNYGYTIVENQTIFLLESINFHDRNFLFVKLAAFLIILSVIWALVKKQYSVKNLLLPLMGLSLAILNVRSFPYLVFISLPATIENFGVTSNKKFLTGLIFLVGLILLGESLLYLNNNYYKYTDSPTRTGLSFQQSVQGSVNFLEKNNLPQPIFNNFDIGSYIIYKTYPQYKVFVDGRPEAYPKDFFSKTYIPVQSNYQQFDQLVQTLGIKTVIFSHTDQTPWAKTFLASIYTDPKWTMVYLDDFMVIYVKQDLAQDMKLTKVNPTEIKLTSGDYYPYLRLAITFLNLNQLQLSEIYAQKALEKFPDSPTANLLMANFTGSNSLFPNPLSQQYLSKSTNWYFW